MACCPAPQVRSPAQDPSTGEWVAKLGDQHASVTGRGAGREAGTSWRNRQWLVDIGPGHQLSRW